MNVPGNYPTIQAAINSVPDGTTIQLAAGTYFELLSVNNVTTRSITIRGVMGATVVDAQGRGRALTIINTTSQIVFDKVIFRNGVIGGGGAGGGFFIQNASPSFFNCTFENNTGYDGAGGAVVHANPTFVNTTIRNNSAQHFGGGVFILQGSRPVFSWSWITGNASGTGPNGVANQGAGGGVFSHDSSPTFRASHINGNSSKFASGGIHHQGVFGSGNGRAMLLVEDTEVADNQSTKFSAGENPAEGGGIHVEDFATGTLNRVRILRNIAGTGGGLNAYRARLDVTDSVVEGNQSQRGSTGGFGGGISASSNLSSASAPASIVNLTRTLVRNNVSAAVAGGSPGIAGGIVVLGDNASSLKATLTLTDSVVDSNSAASEGGGILVTKTNLTITNSLIMRNTVSGGAAPGGGGLRVTQTSTAAISGSTFARNTANGGTSGLGGGVFFDQTNSISISGSNFYANTASSRGSAIFVGSGSTGTINNNIIADNTNPSPFGEINEDACQAVTYSGNQFAPSAIEITSPGSCHLGRESGGFSANPRFNELWAVPGNGTSTTLAWSVARATQVTIAGVGSFSADTGTVDVAPGASTTYSMTATASGGNGGNYSATSAGFTQVNRPSAPVPPRSGRTVDGDFDGDGKADRTVFRPGTGTWFTINSSTGGATGVQWGNSTDRIVQGDYDGDGKTDVAVFRPGTGTWFVINSSTGGATGVQWGNSSDVVVPGDYDGDGKTDVAVFRPGTGTWFIINSSTGGATGVQWGNNSDIVVPGDYDGDGKTDVAVFRPGTGTWFVVNSSTGGATGVQWGNSSDIPVPGDYDGDGKTDVAVFRPSSGTWFVINSSTGGATGVQWGNSSDTPILAR